MLDCRHVCLLRVVGAGATACQARACTPPSTAHSAKPRPRARLRGRRAHKPSSVLASVAGERVVAIHLGPTSPWVSSDVTRKLGRAALKRSPIPPCSRWGLPCGRRYRRPGELLPHPFTLTARPESGAAVYSLLHFPRGHPHQALPGILPCGARTFLPPPPKGRPATTRAAPTAAP